MSDLEFYLTLSTFGSGFVLLAILFYARAKIIKRCQLLALQAKATVHYLTRPAEDRGTVIRADAAQAPFTYEIVDTDEAARFLDDRDYYESRSIR